MARLYVLTLDRLRSHYAGQLRGIADNRPGPRDHESPDILQRRVGHLTAALDALTAIASGQATAENIGGLRSSVEALLTMDGERKRSVGPPGGQQPDKAGLTAAEAARVKALIQSGLPEDAALQVIVAERKRQADMARDVPAELRDILARGDFAELQDDELAKASAWLAANPGAADFSFRGQPDRERITAFEDAKRRLRAVVEYNRALQPTPTAQPQAPPPEDPQVQPQDDDRKAPPKRKRTVRPRPLTDKQTLALELYGKHNSSIEAVATVMGLSRATVHQHLRAAWRKLPALAPKPEGRRGRTQALPMDDRGQVAVAADCRRR